jgi:hypothetical protein
LFEFWQWPNFGWMNTVPKKEQAMQDMQVHLEKLRTEASECQMISDLASNKQKRDLFAMLAEHHRRLADEIERAILEQRATG